MVRLIPARKTYRMMAAYLDEAYRYKLPNRRVCFVGYVSTEQDWWTLEDDWDRTLRKHKLPFIHTADFLARQGDHPDAPDQYEERCAILGEFVSLIRQRVLAGFVADIDVSAYEIATSDIKTRVKAPVLAFSRLLRLALDFLDNESYPGLLPLMLDDDPQYAMRCYQYFGEIKDKHPRVKRRIPSIGFGVDHFLKPLQAADILGRASIHEGGEGDPATGVFRRLLETDPQRPVYVMEKWDAVVIERRKDDLRRIAMDFPS